MDQTWEKFKENSFIIAIVLFIIIVIIMFVNVRTRANMYDTSLRGLWAASDDFCQRSEIDGMMVYIGPASGWSGYRRVVLTMYADGVIIIYKTILAKFSGGIGDYISPFMSNTAYRDLELFDIGENGEPTVASDNINDLADIQDESNDDVTQIRISKIMPPNMEVEIRFDQGCMKWIGEDGKVYAELYRNNVGSMYGEQPYAD